MPSSGCKGRGAAMLPIALLSCISLCTVCMCSCAVFWGHACILPCCSCSVLCSCFVFLNQKAESLEACFSSFQKQLLEATKLASRSCFWNTQHQHNSNFPRSASQARSLIFWLAALFRKYGFEAGSFVSELSAQKTSFQNALLEARSQNICCQPCFLTSLCCSTTSFWPAGSGKH